MQHKNSVASSWPFFDTDEIEAVTATLQSGKVNYWTGTQCREFETEFADTVGCKHAVALANGTLALELALHALGIGPGDEVIVTPRTFLASASAAIVQGISPVFADVDLDSGNITAETIERVITPQTKAIITVHLAGWPCDMDPILELARGHNIKVIEDCAQCHGATYKGRPCGSLGDVAAWSFCQDKIMTTGGEGGMLTTNNTELWKKAWSYKDHGKSYEAVYNHHHEPGFRWLHETFGTNWRMMEVQAAIGRIQLRKLSDWVTARRRNASILHETLSSLPSLRTPTPKADFGHAYYKFYTYVVAEALVAGWSRDRVMTELNDRGIPCTTGSCSEIYLEKAFEKTGFRPSERLAVARELGETSLMFLVHPTLSESQISAVADEVRSVMEDATAGEHLFSLPKAA